MLSADKIPQDGECELAVLVENTGGGGGISGGVYAYLKPADYTPIPERAESDFDDSSWRRVDIPHDYVIEGKMSERGSHAGLEKPEAWYRKTFEAPKSWEGKAVSVDFDGVFRNFKVWLNGRYLGNNKSGYIGTAYEISKYLNFGGKNTLAVFVDPSSHEGWWYEGGGIYRHVWLNVRDNLHIAKDGVFVKSEVKNIDGDFARADLKVEVSVKNFAEVAENFSLVCEIFDETSKLVKSSELKNLTLDGGGSGEFGLNFSMERAELWSLENTALYEAQVRIERAGSACDKVSQIFGVRSLRFDPEEGFFLNEKPVKIKGTCNHMDFPGLGVALPDNLHAWRINKLKAVGCNAWRTSHNPVNSEMLDACDRLGMLVLNETRHFGDTSAMKSALETPSDDLSELKLFVLRDRNHPSVIAWSIANEEHMIEKTKQGEAIAKKMRDIVYELDGTRPVTAGVIEHFAGYGGISNVIDIEGFNYGPAQNFDKFKKLHPAKPQLATEITSALATRGEYKSDSFFVGKKADLVHMPTEYWGDEKRGYMNALGLSPDRGHATSASWKPIAERKFVSGGFVWTGFDYKAEPHPFGWPNISSQFGFMDTCGFPKCDYYYYKAWWQSEPFVKIATHWNWGKGGEKVKVMVHGNCEEVELFLNGRSLGKRSMPRYEYLLWELEYEPGTLEARGFNGGKLAASDRVKTAGKPSKIALKSDILKLAADGRSVSPVEVAVVDREGNVVPYADNEIKFSVSLPAKIAGVGNGDPRSHEPDKSDTRRAFHGLCMVLVQAGAEPGEVVLRAEAEGLKPATLRLLIEK